MPTPYIQKVAKDKGKPVSEIEALWAQAKEAAAKEGHAGDYAYITGVFKKMAHVSHITLTASSIPALKALDRLSGH